MTKPQWSRLARRTGGAMQEAYRKGIADLPAIYAGLVEAPTKRQREDRARAALAAANP